MTAQSTEQILNRLMEGYRDLSPQLRRAAQYVLDHPNDIGVSSMRQLAAAADVKPNTLVRMAKTLGFEGYEDFRRPFREMLRRGSESFPDRARWLQSLAQGRSHGQLLGRMAASSLTNIEQLFSGTTADEVKAAADSIVASRATYVLGVGSCHSIAQNFCYVARMALDNLVPVATQGSVPVDDLARIGAGDVLVAMTFAPYRTEVVEATTLARRHRARVIAITDSRASPVALDAEHVFIVPTGTPQFFMSVSAVVALLETLLAFMVADADREVIANIEAFHRARYAAGVYWQDEG